jgi:hypothetical protein
MTLDELKKKLCETSVTKENGNPVLSGKFYVYEHWRLDKNEYFYVGKGHGTRAYVTKKRNKHHRAITEKLSREGSAFDVKIVAMNLTEEEAFRIEVERIAFWRNDGADLTNLTTGGQGTSGCSPSAETRKKLSELNKGKPSAFKGKKHKPETIAFYIEKGKRHGPPKQTEEVRKKIISFHTGRKRSSETCKRISESLKGKPSKSKGKPSKLKGRALSVETKEKMRLSSLIKWERQKESGWINPRKGETCSEEAREKMKISARRRWSLPNASRRNEKGQWVAS